MFYATNKLRHSTYLCTPSGKHNKASALLCLSKNLFFGKVGLLRKEAEWRFLRLKVYTDTSKSEKASNKRKQPAEYRHHVLLLIV